VRDGANPNAIEPENEPAKQNLAKEEHAALKKDGPPFAVEHPSSSFFFS
jgi:hypothetical protein